MSKYLYVLSLILLSSTSMAANYAIKAEYSFGIGIPIPDIKDKAFTTLQTGKDLKSETQCLTELNSETIAHFALGQTMRAGATDVVLKCVKYWSNDQCAAMYPGCISSADVGNAKHIHLYNSKSSVPNYLRLSPSAHEVLQSIAYTKDENSDGNLEILFVAQVKYDGNAFYQILGKQLNCGQAINTPEFEATFKKMYFSDKQAMAYKFNCFSVNNNGSSKISGEKVMRR